MLAPLVAVLVWADRKLTIDGCGEDFSPGPNELFSARRPPTRNPTDGSSAPYSIRTPLVKACVGGDWRAEAKGPGGEPPGVFRPDTVPPLDPSGRFGQGLANTPAEAGCVRIGPLGALHAGRRYG